MESVYVVDVAIVGYCKVSVTATDMDEARELAADYVTPLHATEWEYVPAEAFSEDDVELVGPVLG